MEQLTKIENEIQRLVGIFERSEEHSSNINQMTLSNDRIIFPVMRKLFSNNITCLSFLLTFLTDSDLFRMAATCRTLNRIIYSPFGFRLLRTLRPLVVEVRKVQQEPAVSVSMFDFTSDKLGKNIKDDDDDLEAVIMTMNTNILAMMHKMKEIDKAKRKYDQKSKLLMVELNQEAQLKEQYMQKNNSRENTIEKLETVNKDSQSHLRSLVDEHNRIFAERMHRVSNLERQRDKLLSQKQLLVRKLKMLMAEAEEQQRMSLSVSNIIKRIGAIVKQK